MEKIKYLRLNWETLNDSPGEWLICHGRDTGIALCGYENWDHAAIWEDACVLILSEIWINIYT